MIECLLLWVLGYVIFYLVASKILETDNITVFKLSKNIAKQHLAMFLVWPFLLTTLSEIFDTKQNLQ